MKNIKNCDRISLVVGPEGGLSNKEEEELNSLLKRKQCQKNRIKVCE